MRIIGIDVGRQHTGIVSWNLKTKSIDINDTLDFALGAVRQIRKYNTSYYRNSLIANTIVSMLDGITDEILLVSIEDYIYGDKSTTVEQVRNMDRSTLEVAEIHGVICSLISSLGIPIIKPSPTLMKYMVAGFGQSDKLQVIQAAYKLYKVSLPDEHQYDALCAAHVGRYFVAYCLSPGSLKVKSYEREAMNRLSFDRRFTCVSDEIIRRFNLIKSQL